MNLVPDLIKIKDLDKAVNALNDFIKYEINDVFQKSGAVIGLSGGIDSSVTAELCSKALGSDRILGLIMPEKESEPSSQLHARRFAEKHKIKTEEINITSILDSFGVYRNKENIIKKIFPDFNDNCKYRIIVPHKLQNRAGVPFVEILDEQNKTHKIKISASEFLLLTAATSVKHRVRMTLLYFYAEKNNFCVVGTTNKSEYMQGYFVKYGDGGSDIEPLVNLYKSQVYQIGKYLNIPDEITTKNASPDVWSLPTSDEEFFYSMPYYLVDLLLYAQENNISIKDIKTYCNLKEDEIEDLFSFLNQKRIKSQHMREIPHSWIPDI